MIPGKQHKRLVASISISNHSRSESSKSDLKRAFPGPRWMWGEWSASEFWRISIILVSPGFLLSVVTKPSICIFPCCLNSSPAPPRRTTPVLWQNRINEQDLWLRSAVSLWPPHRVTILPESHSDFYLFPLDVAPVVFQGLKSMCGFRSSCLLGESVVKRFILMVTYLAYFRKTPRYSMITLLIQN